MNSVHEQCPCTITQTVTANSALKQNWVGCTVRTPKTQVAHTLRAQCPGRGRCCAHNKLVTRMSRAQPTQVARSACAGHALWCPGRGRKSRPPFLVQPQAKSRHHFQVATSWRLTYVATSNWCHDTAQATPGRDLQTRSRHRFSCPASSQVATSK